MDPIALQAGTALVKTMTTDVWAGAKRVVSGWWHHHHPEPGANAEQADAGPGAHPAPLLASTNRTEQITQTATVTGNSNTITLVGRDLQQPPTR